MNLSEFAYIPKSERDALDSKNFGWPERRLFPVRPGKSAQADLDSAAHLIGRAKGGNPDEIKKKLIAIAKRLKLKIPVSWKVEMSETTTENEIMTAEFVLETKKDTEDGEYVLRTGKIFEAGSYPDKKFEISPEELLVAANEFKPVDLDLEHTPTILDGKLGKLEAVQVAENGYDLIGTARIPKWLDKLLEDGERKVSATWDRANKQLNKLALVRNPRVSDAALLSAFSAHSVAANTPLEEVISEVMHKWFEDANNLEQFAHKTWEGVSTLQSIHDMASRSGAVCGEPDKKSNFVSKNESKLIQQIHDASIKGGAACSSMKSGSSMYSESNEENKNMAFWDEFKKVFNIKDEDFALATKASEAEDSEETNKEDKTVKNNADEKKDEVVEAKADVKDAVEDKDAKLSAANAEIEALKAKFAEIQEAQIVAEATLFAETEISENRAMPAERDAIIGFYVQAAKDDQVLGTKVAFKKDGADAEGTRIDSLKSIFSVRKPHELTKEKLAGMSAKVLDTKADDDGDVNKRYAEEAKKQAEEYLKSYKKPALAATK